MRLSERWQSGGRPTVSFEVFPARTPKAAARLPKVLDKLVALEPDFFSVTFGAGGTTTEGSYRLARALVEDHGQQVLAYFAGFGLGPQQICAALDPYRDLGIDNVLVVRGDEPRGQQEFEPHPGSLPHASDLLAFISERYGFCLGAAGYPEGHVQAESPQADLGFLRLKVERGAQFIVANYFYDTRFFLDFRQRCRAAGIAVPIVPGVMPVFSVKMMESLASLCGATLTDELRAGVATLDPSDKGALVRFGVDFATAQCRELLAAGVPGLHFYTMDRTNSVTGILRTLRDEGLL